MTNPGATGSEDRDNNSRGAKNPASAALRTLRLLLFGTIFVPLLIGVTGAYFSYRAIDQRADAALAAAAAVAVENTTKVLDTHMLVAARIADLLHGLSDAEIRRDEKKLHTDLAAQIEGLPQVAAAWVIDASGHELVSARVYPVNAALDHSNREDFRALQKGRVTTFITAVRARSLKTGAYQPFFTVSRVRRNADGSFAGVIVVAVSGNYFASFYNSLLGGSPQDTAIILRDDGSILARYSTTASSGPRPAETLLAAAVAGKSFHGLVESGSTFGLSGMVIAYQRLAEYPVYVAIGRTRASILREWAGSVATLAAVGAASAIALILLSLIALRRTRREQAALAQARDATARRAAIEAQLDRAQKLEAVGLLTAGIAHDFNNLLTVIVGNIELLRAASDGSAERRHRLIASALAACERGSRLTRRLLGFARREPVDPQAIDAATVIASVSDLPWRSLGDRVALSCRIPPNLWPVFVDPNQMENAFLNLALNARDAMDGRGNLIIEATNISVDRDDAENNHGVPLGDYVAIKVIDDGCGMIPEVRDRALDPFFTTKDGGKGTGLGLAQVHGFVTRFGGYCTIDSEPGKGTAVCVYLPRYVRLPEQCEATRSPASP
ncbi:MAG TPA: ATP-binding protein [Stellaceae bacterium]|nr:ATP-binding protein [Stellaceae bacterium]